MKILLITYNYPPAENPRAFRWGMLVKYLVNAGYSFDIICQPHKGKKNFEVNGKERIYRGDFFLLDKLRNSSLFCRTKGTGETKRKTNKKDIFIYEIVHAFLSKIKLCVKKNVWPDYSCFWFLFARKKMKMLLKHNFYDLILTISHPFGTHLLGVIAKKYCPKLPWVVEIGDPFLSLDITGYYKSIKRYRKISHNLEYKVFKLADAICVPERNFANKYKRLFPFASQKVFVSPPLFSLVDYIGLQNKLDSKMEKKRFVFIGALGGKLRSPEHLLELFSQFLLRKDLEEIELHIYGLLGNDDFDKYFTKYTDLLNKSIYFHGIVSREKTVEAMRNAYILINVSNKCTIGLPSKLLDYVSIGKPILNLASVKKDTSAVFLRNYSSALNLFEYEPMNLQVDKLYKFFQECALVDKVIVHNFMKPYLIDSIGQHYFQLISRLAKVNVGK